MISLRETASRAAPEARQGADRGNHRGSHRKVMVLGIDTPIGLAILRDLGRHGYSCIGISANRSALGRFSKHCHRFVLRAQGEDALVLQIRDLAARLDAGFLIAISETDLLMINRHRTALEERVTVLTPTSDRLDLVLDKARCQELAEAAGLTVPRTYQFATLAEAQDSLDALAFPVVLKWPDPPAVASTLAKAGISLLKTEFALTGAELMQRLARYEKVRTFPMVQEYCPGHGLGQMFLLNDGDVVMEFQHERIHEWPPEGGFSTLCRSVPLTEHRAVRERSRALLKRLRWHGVAMVEYRYDPGTGTYCFMEINGRFWGSLPLAIASGVPFAAGLVSVCGEAGPAPPIPEDYGCVTSCYWVPETKRLLRLLFRASEIRDPHYRLDRWSSLWDYLVRQVSPATRYYVFQLSDPKPFLWDIASVLAKACAVMLRVKRV